jgi:hypothetical protein
MIVPTQKPATSAATKSTWQVTWTRSPARLFGGKVVPSRPLHKGFDDQRTAVWFVMEELDERFRETARLIFAAGLSVELPVIKQIHADYRKDKRKARPRLPSKPRAIDPDQS